MKKFCYRCKKLKELYKSTDYLCVDCRMELAKKNYKRRKEEKDNYEKKFGKIY